LARLEAFEIRKAMEMTTNSLGINLVCARMYFHELFDVRCSIEQCTVVESSSSTVVVSLFSPFATTTTVGFGIQNVYQRTEDRLATRPLAPPVPIIALVNH
jgi:hypothetical protein